MVTQKAFKYKGEDYKAFVFENKKHYGWFIVLKYPIVLQKGEHKTHNKAYKRDLHPEESKDIDTLIKDWKQFKFKELWEKD